MWQRINILGFIIYEIFSREVSSLLQIKGFSWLKRKCLNRKSYRTNKMSQMHHIKLCDFNLEKSTIKCCAAPDEKEKLQISKQLDLM